MQIRKNITTRWLKSCQLGAIALGLAVQSCNTGGTSGNEQLLAADDIASIVNDLLNNRLPGNTTPVTPAAQMVEIKVAPRESSDLDEIEFPGNWVCSMTPYVGSDYALELGQARTIQSVAQTDGTGLATFQVDSNWLKAFSAFRIRCTNNVISGGKTVDRILFPDASSSSVYFVDDMTTFVHDIFVESAETLYGLDASQTKMADVEKMEKLLLADSDVSDALEDETLTRVIIEEAMDEAKTDIPAFVRAKVCVPKLRATGDIDSNSNYGLAAGANAGVLDNGEAVDLETGVTTAAAVGTSNFAVNLAGQVCRFDGVAMQEACDESTVDWNLDIEIEGGGVTALDVAATIGTVESVDDQIGYQIDAEDFDGSTTDVTYSFIVLPKDDKNPDDDGFQLTSFAANVMHFENQDSDDEQTVNSYSHCMNFPDGANGWTTILDSRGEADVSSDSEWVIVTDAALGAGDVWFLFAPGVRSGENRDEGLIDIDANNDLCFQTRRSKDLSDSDVTDFTDKATFVYFVGRIDGTPAADISTDMSYCAEMSDANWDPSIQPARIGETAADQYNGIEAAQACINSFAFFNEKRKKLV